MAYVLNNPEDFADELTAGFAAAYGNWVTRVDGGVVRSTEVPQGQVAIVTGGGSGHYPAFAGLVGPGLATGAAMGNIFASPSAQQVYNVAKAAQTGGGVLLTYGNYAGDVLNFTQAQERLRAEGIPCETVIVTDDIASSPPEKRHERRGIAGDLFVFKVAAAAAEAGKSLDEVVDIATAANNMTRTLGVAFTGCTLPGAEDPLFTVPEGRMAIGMGIHGEPGIDEQAIPTSHELADLLVTKLLAEKPADSSDRAVVLLNGLGGVKYEELFVLYGSVSRLLADAGVTIVEPDVGELVTSFEMAGVSLTLSWLTDELAGYWSAPASTPAYRKGSVTLTRRRSTFEHNQTEQDHLTTASEVSQAAAVRTETLLQAVKTVIDTNVNYLGELDSIAGDGDHGIGMQRGSTAAAKAGADFASRGAGVGTLLTAAGDAWADKAGGTSGALWGLLITTLGRALGDTEEISASALSTGISTGVASVQKSGGAQVGDKTMVDALVPFAQRFQQEAESGTSLLDALRLASNAADDAAKATADLTPTKGRARTHTTKSVGTPDPGAVSFALITKTLVTALEQG